MGINRPIECVSTANSSGVRQCKRHGRGIRVIATLLLGCILWMTGSTMEHGLLSVHPAKAAVALLPPELHEQSLNLSEVQRIVKQEFVTPQGTIQCTIAIGLLVGQNVIPAAKFWRLIREAGGIKEFAKIAYFYLKNGFPPPNASEELGELLMGLTGLGDVVEACQ